MRQADQLAVQTIAAWTSLIAKIQTRSVNTQFLDQLADVVRTIWDRSPMAHFASALTLSAGDGNRGLADIKSDECAILHVVSPPFLRLGASLSGATLERRMPRERPPNQSAHTAIMGSKE